MDTQTTCYHYINCHQSNYNEGERVIFKILWYPYQLSTVAGSMLGVYMYLVYWPIFTKQTLSFNFFLELNTCFQRFDMGNLEALETNISNNYGTAQSTDLSLACYAPITRPNVIVFNGEKYGTHLYRSLSNHWHGWITWGQYRSKSSQFTKNGKGNTRNMLGNLASQFSGAKIN